ncbi:Uncharacterised protein [Mesomycoplasma neurolyticum]|uniref:Uncharacterized protein n=1 Tax=Mesomycoplasma neurolyticum TaxID=2120 RepID=A0A449A5T0_9BACT|nr:Uncharacterised protein [Mesomycoplasma neurolyticum]
MEDINFIETKKCSYCDEKNCETIIELSKKEKYYVRECQPKTFNTLPKKNSKNIWYLKKQKNIN